MPLSACVICWPTWACVRGLVSSSSTSIAATGNRRNHPRAKPENRRPWRLHLERDAHHGTDFGFETHPARPFVILGGPEVSYETDSRRLSSRRLCHHRRSGFEVCRSLPTACSLAKAPANKIIPAEVPDLDKLTLPYELYTDDDVAHRIIYVEASRGCPFTCEFCLSSLDIPVRQFPLPALLERNAGTAAIAACNNSSLSIARSI